MQMRVVEKVAFDVPSLAIHLLPLRTRVEHGHHAAIVHGFSLRSLGRAGLEIGDRREKPIVATEVKKLLAVEGDVVAAEPAKDLLCLTLFSRKAPERADRRAIFR